MQVLMKAFAVAAVLVSVASADDRLMNFCAVDSTLESVGPYSNPTIELTSNNPGGNKLLQTTAQSSFSVDTAGVGQATGASFTIPAFTQANVTINLGVPALTSLQVRNLRDAWAAILDLTQRNSLREYERQDRSHSRNLGFLGWFCGGKTARSSTTVRHNMESRGLTNHQINQLIESFRQIAEAMSTVQMRFTVFNQNNPYSVSGNVLVWVMSGYITTSETQTQFRVISDGGVATGTQGNSNAGGEIIPLTL